MEGGCTRRAGGGATGGGRKITGGAGQQRRECAQRAVERHGVTRSTDHVTTACHVTRRPGA
eukprot:2111358-Rhodomonas_salina.1